MDEDELVFVFEEHETGPEILVYLTVTAAGVTLAASVINLVSTIIQARQEGLRRGDRQNDPAELVVRRVVQKGDVKEEVVMRLSGHDVIDDESLEKMLISAIPKLLEGESEDSD